ncbi:hypothetical protein GCM10010335_61070 [Streptomyces galbus]|nr:hypothetical protein GCM10010335_61070 [Streptomyces galbus]
MPAAAHSAGSSKRLAEASAAANDAAEDGANPKVTVLPSATAHTAGGSDWGERAPQQTPTGATGEPCGERNSILPAELGCGNEQLGPPTVMRRCVAYITTQAGRT